MDEATINNIIDLWADGIGNEKFMQMNEVIDQTLGKVAEINDTEELLAVIEGSSIGLAASIETEQSFFDAVEKEMILANITQDQSDKIKTILRGMISTFHTIGGVIEPVVLEEQEETIATTNTTPAKASVTLPDFEHQLELEPPSAPSPADVLATIRARMTEAKAIAPTKRDYSLVKTTPIAKPASVQNIPIPETPTVPQNTSSTQNPTDKHDPYREIPAK